MKIKNILTLILFYVGTTFMMVGQSTTITLQPDKKKGKDAYVMSEKSSMNFGNAPHLMVRTSNAQGKLIKTRGIIDFDVSGIPDGAVILDAKLTLSPLKLNGNNAIAIKRVTQNWKEQAITWNNQPKTDRTHQVTIKKSTSARAYTKINVKDLIIDRLKNPRKNYGMMVQLLNENKLGLAIFASSDHPEKDKRPKLEITYMPAPTLTSFTCGVPSLSSQELSELNINVPQDKGTRSNTLLKIPIAVHHVLKNNGTGASINYADIQNAVSKMNIQFAPANIQFFLCSYETIAATQYFDFVWNQENSLVNASMMSTPAVNVFIANSLLHQNGGYPDGWANYPGLGVSKNIFLTQNAINRPHVMTHEFGHFFGLIHTHGSDNSTLTNELVDGSNCGTAGDLVCDTPAEPKLNDNGLVDNATDCNYIGTLTDNNNQGFSPDVGNVMSYALDGCIDFLTSEQYARIRYFAEGNFRSYLYDGSKLGITVKKNGTTGIGSVSLDLGFYGTVAGATSWTIEDLSFSQPTATGLFNHNGNNFNFTGPDMNMNYPLGNPGYNFQSCGKYRISYAYTSCTTGQIHHGSTIIKMSDLDNAVINSFTARDVVVPHKDLELVFDYDFISDNTGSLTYTIHQGSCIGALGTPITSGILSIDFDENSTILETEIENVIANMLPGTYNISISSTSGGNKCETFCDEFEVKCATKTDFVLRKNNGNGWYGSTHHFFVNDFPIDATMMTWKIQNITQSDPIYFKDIPSTQNSFYFTDEFSGFTWIPCNQYRIELSYIDNCSGLPITEEKIVYYDNDMDPQVYLNKKYLTSKTNQTLGYAGYRYVQKGAVVTIKNSTLKFLGQSSGIVVEEGGTLIIDNSTISGVCDQIWNGIRVQGDSSKPVDVNTHPNTQGWLIITNNAIIKNARFGIQLSKGGILTAKNSNFINNEKGIVASNRADAQISISKCLFETNDDIPFPVMREFIQLKNTKALIRGNTFRNSTSNIITGGTGILSYYSEIKVIEHKDNNPVPVYTPNTFENLKKGIVHNGAHGSDLLFVKGNTFTNISQGISTSKSNGDQIRANVFTIAPVTGSETDVHQWGIYVDRCKNHDIYENTFIGTSISGVGVVNSQTLITLPPGFSNDGYSGNIYQNTFEDTHIALQIQGSNQRTLINCNDFRNNNDFAIVVTSSFFGKTAYRGRQGNLGSCAPGKGAGNLFSPISIIPPVNPVEKHIRLDDGADPFTYSDFGGPLPLYTNMNIALTYCNTAATNSCDPINPQSGGGLSLRSAIANNQLTNFKKALLEDNLVKAETLLKSEKNYEENLEIFKAYVGNYQLDLKVTVLENDNGKEQNNDIDIEPINMLVHPNPSNTGIFNLKIQGFDTNKTIQVLDISGKLMYTISVTDSQSKLDLSNYSRGLYFVKVSDGIHQKTQKVVF